MLARDWYYNQRRKIGLDSAVAAIYDRHDDSDIRARAALTMLGVKPGWRMADIGCGNGVLACEAALMGAEVDAIDISPAMLALADIQAKDRKVAIRTQPAGLLSFAYKPNSYDLIVSEFTLHHLPDFWKAVALSRIFAALADPTRRDMVARLSAGDATVNQLAEPYQLTLQAIYKHLKVLEDAGVVSRPPGPQPRTVRLEAEVFDLMDKWIERYRRQAEERYRRLDAVLARMNDETGNDSQEQKGSVA